MLKASDIEQVAKKLEISSSTAKKVGKLLDSAAKSLHSGTINSARSALRSSLDMIDGLKSSLHEDIDLVEKGISSYIRSEEYFQEVESECLKVGLQLERNRDQWYCFPSTVELEPDSESVLINGTKSSELMPARIAARLLLERDAANSRNLKPFAELLLKAFTAIGGRETTTVVPLLEIFNILTLWPEQRRRYSRASFALDLYLLDRSSQVREFGKRLVFASSTGARDRTKVFSMRDETGFEKVYYGIYYVNEEAEGAGHES